ncbi:orotate phosphoribosyltransferase [Flavobacteriaceae bacterium]|jgi:orotate phosphoribosyltransferase|nr:orotate phosphoribosyltransferase [Flavobacteriaceae bacterium]MBT4313937.1 orotate phosphoribosyltransferase [Flavobacteriaceae bacterium]MBT5091087.1 orotate phosphoribosyltransferase [Flavobacteriaceae bacterium]MBT5282674.1 orotate phosphoribosyltransferase [Flavobacteriaceae bacterium]MBT5446912.1 orotate phosphoribosyltransferase [Flavobacteriaceae bacterium]|tara:strand:+ start:7047 stop:7697 length:651 start_codon:yes stop_codon:yes gene_type:complete
MIFNQNIAQLTAEYLLQINAIKLNPENPFTWASGWKSPIYCDNRVALSYPAIRTFLSKSIAHEIKSQYGLEIVIAGVATGAIGIGMLVAQELNLPFIYVRPEPKKHGRQNQIEGAFEPGKKVVVIEDLISTGMSSLNAVTALQNAGATILGMFALFTYGFEKAEKAFNEAGIELQTLCDYENLLPVALKENKISQTQSENLKTWRKDPSSWSPSQD